MLDIIKKISKSNIILMLFCIIAFVTLLPQDSWGGSYNPCRSEGMKAQYMGEDVAEACWYCKVVIMMTNAFLSAANDALSVCQELGHLILKLGFSIWLALFVLKNVTSFAPITPGKMLQELLVMGFKCAFMNIAIADGINFITTLILNPIMITGTDIGYTLLEGLMKYNTDI